MLDRDGVTEIESAMASYMTMNPQVSSTDDDDDDDYTVKDKSVQQFGVRSSIYENSNWLRPPRL